MHRRRTSIIGLTLNERKTLKMQTTFQTAKTIEQAIEQGLKELGKTRDEVSIEIINEGGLFSKAKVKLTVDAVAAPAPKAEPAVGVAPKSDPQPAQDKYFDEIKRAEKDFKKEQKEEKKNPKPLKGANISPKPQPAPEQPQQEQRKPTVTVSGKPQPQQPREQKEKPKRLPSDKPQVAISSKDFAVVGFVERLLKHLSIDGKVEATANDRELFMKITSEGSLSQLIGRDGDTLTALQHIASYYPDKRENNRRVHIDAGNYKGQKEEKLKQYADRMANEVIEQGEGRKLRAMSAYERRVIHTHLQQNDRVQTVSKGEEPRRFLIILPKR